MHKDHACAPDQEKKQPECEIVREWIGYLVDHFARARVCFVRPTGLRVATDHDDISAQPGLKSRRG